VIKYLDLAQSKGGQDEPSTPQNATLYCTADLAADDFDRPHISGAWEGAYS
jgi:hypothetical protein